MKPLSLRLQSFGSYGKETKIDFSRAKQNLFLVTGDTGSGKSTIFDAIVYALYGKTGSVENPREGEELQSQFGEDGKEPFVELEFTEVNGGIEEKYIVKRIPKHVRKKLKGTGEKSVSASVSLIMPDGTEYPQKEANKKLEEIVGLTREQFLQVAMIAQGEFMELLRAKSDDKKVIFRKLFHTGLFQKIVDELASRVKAKGTEIAKIRTICQTYVSQTLIPEGNERGEILEEYKNSIINSKTLNSVEFEGFIHELEMLVRTLESEKVSLEKECEELEKIRDKALGNYRGAENIIKFFDQIDTAQRELKECEENKENASFADEQSRKIREAYEIKAIADKYHMSEKNFSETKAKLSEESGKIQTLRANEEKSKSKYEEESAKLREELERFSKVEERVNSSLETFKEIERVSKGLKECEEKHKQALEEKQKALAAKNLREEEEKRYRARGEELKDAKSREVKYIENRKKMDGFEHDARQLEEKEKYIAKHEAAVEKCRAKYVIIRKKVANKSREYEDIRRSFLDAQAGFIAREQLKEGEPCPVCGSLDHPRPCELVDGADELTREKVETLKEEVDKLKGEQEKAAAEAETSERWLRETKQRHKEDIEGLRNKIVESLNESLKEKAENIQDASSAMAVIAQLKTMIDSYGAKIQSDVKEYEEIQAFLNDEVSKKKIEERLENSKNSEAETSKEKAVLEAALKKLEESKAYENAEEAKDELRNAENVRKQAEDSERKASNGYKAIKTEVDSVSALIERYTKELPELEAEKAERLREYEGILEEKGNLRDSWEELTSAHTLAKAEELRELAESWKRKNEAATKMLKAAKEAVADTERPDLEMLSERCEKADRENREARERLEKCKKYYNTDSEKLESLNESKENRGRILSEYSKISTLYDTLAGKVSGARMDIETFVQRNYLEMVLENANRRFENMSHGQFELRMIDIDKAGEGRTNHGLDLMVYSNVTGKTREVRTLSGGESFMAALSLALGMADVITQNAASVNLDIMFIDEGFGSLDDNSRDQAVRILKEMAGGQRVIGIISHVSELKQQIESQLIVSKDDEGSHTEWQLS